MRVCLHPKETRVLQLLLTLLTYFVEENNNPYTAFKELKGGDVDNVSDKEEMSVIVMYMILCVVVL